MQAKVVLEILDKKLVVRVKEDFWTQRKIEVWLNGSCLHKLKIAYPLDWQIIMQEEGCTEFIGPGYGSIVRCKWKIRFEQDLNGTVYVIENIK